MCEFTVYLAGGNPEEKEQIAKEIIIAKTRDGKVILLNMAGEAVHVESAVIKEVNTMTQVLLLQKMTDS